MVEKKDENFICHRFLEHIKKIDPHNLITDFVMFDGALSLHLSGKRLKIHHTKVSVVRGGEHTISLFFNDVSKIRVVN